MMRRVGFFTLKFARDLEAGEAGEIYVEHGDVGFFFEDEFQRGLAIARLADQFKAR